MSMMFFLSEESDVAFDEEDANADEQLVVLMNGPNAPKVDARIGDCMRLCVDMYLNESVIILGKHGWGTLDYSLDDYGAVPPWFTYPEFPLDYWENTLDHNIRHIEASWLAEHCERVEVDGNSGWKFHGGSILDEGLGVYSLNTDSLQYREGMTGACNGWSDLK